MNIDHIALYVSDLEQTKDFFVHFFGASANQLYYNQKTGFKSYFLTFEGGSRLEIMTRPDLCNTDKNPLRSGFAHIAISVGTKEGVDSLTKTLSDAGYSIQSGPRTTGDGCYESCIAGPENNLIEITV
jgi:lactoylglutathione lyase